MEKCTHPRSRCRLPAGDPRAHRAAASVDLTREDDRRGTRCYHGIDRVPWFDIDDTFYFAAGGFCLAVVLRSNV